MLLKINRIRKKGDFEKIFKNSRSFRSNLFILRIGKNNLDTNRFGFVVSQKISKRAVIRNKVKRRLSDAIRAEIKNIKSGADVVFIALPGIEKKEFSEIKSTVENTIIKAGLFLK